MLRERARLHSVEANRARLGVFLSYLQRAHGLLPAQHADQTAILDNRQLIDILKHHCRPLGSPIAMLAHYLKVRRDMGEFTHHNRFGNKGLDVGTSITESWRRM